MAGKTLVTGGTGFIGYHITKCLLEKGYLIRLLIHKSNRKFDFFQHPNLEIVKGDVLDTDSLKRAMEGCNTVYHAAGIVSFNPNLSDVVYKVNVDGTENVCKLALENGIEKLVYTSSAASIGKNPNGLSNENTKFNLWDISSDYKKSKVLAEDKVMEYYRKFKLPVVILNPALPIGTHDFRPSPPGNMILNYANSKRAVIYPDGGMSFIDVEDVAQAHYLAEKKGKNGERYILGNENLTIHEFYRVLDKVFHTKKIKIRVPYYFALMVGHMSQKAVEKNTREPKIPEDGVKLIKQKMFYDVSKAKNELGIRLSPVESACKKAVEWFIQEKYINV